MEINEVVKPFWHVPTSTFFRSYMGNGMMYWHETIGAWVTPEEADEYPQEMTAARDEAGNWVWTQASLED